MHSPTWRIWRLIAVTSCVLYLTQQSDAQFLRLEANRHVAQAKGEKHSVHPALLLAIRYHENPSPNRDHYALGVVAKRGTDIWTQYEWGARIVRRVAQRQGWSPMEPTLSRVQRLGRVYCGRGWQSWARNVWSNYRSLK